MTQTRQGFRRRSTAILLVAAAAIVALVGPRLYSSAANIYEKIQTLNQMIAIINENYVEPVEWDRVLDGAFHGLLKELDPHSAYLPKEEFETSTEMFSGKFEGIGIEFDLLGGYITVISPIVGSPSDKAGLLPGDQIVEIDGASAHEIAREDVVKKLRGPKGTKVTITVRRAARAKPFEVTLVRDQIPIHSVTAAFFLDRETGYIRLSRFSSTTGGEVRTAIERLRSEGMMRLIFDLRTNSGGYLEQAVEVADQFETSSDTLVYTLGRKEGMREVFRDNPKTGSGNFPLIILVNRWSASASEIVAGAVQDLDRGLVLGETTFGKGLVQRQWPLKSGGALRLTVSRYYTPSGRLIQRPYDNGTEEYYSLLTDAQREAALDSLKETRPKYVTKRGRTVCGGGGISPDIYLPETTYSEAASKIVTHEKRFTFEWGNREGNAIREKVSSLAEFKDQYAIAEEEYLNFLSSVRRAGVPADPEVLEADAPHLRNMLKAEVAGAIWGRSAYYEVLALGDPQIVAAMGRFPEAAAFLP